MQVEVRGARLWFDVDGPALVPDGPRMRRRPTVVLLHGGPGSFDHSYLKPDFARLAEVAQVVYLDLPGHGRSAHGDPASWSFERCADDVRGFCDALGIARPVVFGHSLGGFVAMLYGARHPGHAGALVLQSTHGRFDLRRIVEGFRRTGGDEVAATAERARTVLHRELNAPGLALMRGFDVLDQLGRVDCPTLVGVGALDPVTPPAAARELAAALPQGATRLEVFAGAGHFTWKDDPGRYWPLLLEFVAGVG
jgi:pimeloyl-ACP methyl ester carboxylesterase